MDPILNASMRPLPSLIDVASFAGGLRHTHLVVDEKAYCCKRDSTNLPSMASCTKNEQELHGSQGAASVRILICQCRRLLDLASLILRLDCTIDPPPLPC